jgi:phage gpG-like protein
MSAPLVQIKLTVSPEANTLLDRMQNRPGMMRAAAKAMDQENTFTLSHIQTRYLNFPPGSSRPTIGLRWKTRRLFNSIRASKSVATSTTVKSAIGSNVKYAAIHEFGGTTRPHVIEAKKGKALKFIIGGQTLLRRRVNHPGSRFTARKFVQTGINDRLADYGEAMSVAIVQFWKENKQ